MRLGLILPPPDDPWRAYNLSQGFCGIAQQAMRAGWAVEFILTDPSGLEGAPAPKGVARRLIGAPASPVLCGPGATSVTASLRMGHLIWREVRSLDCDVIVGPLAGGLLQPLLMSRAVGESLQRTAVVLWADPPSARRARYDDAALSSPRPLVDDALEQACYRLADLIVAASASDIAHLRAWRPDGARTVEALLCAPVSDLGPTASRHEEAIREILFMGAGTASHGADRFLAAADRSADVSGRSTPGIVFAGPWRSEAPGLSKTMLGLRATRWPFAFEAPGAASPSHALDRLRQPGCIAAFLGPVTDDDVLVRQALQTGAPVVLAHDHRLVEPLARSIGRVAAGFETLGELEAACDQERPGPLAPPPDWVALLSEAVAAVRSAKAGWVERRVSVCITHKDRPAALARAIASVRAQGPAGAEVVVVDAGSREPQSAVALESLESQGVIVIRKGATAQGRACDLAAARATGEMLVFLDDDNVYLDGGLSRLTRALAASRFDVVVSNLALYDGEPGVGACDAELVFLGEAGSAGLFFNGFGDISLAVLRAAFERIGGFGPYDGPGLDWAFLARARREGLRIGVLQQPAVAYARSAALAGKWRKFDQEGARRHILECYSGAFDADLVARLAQLSTLDVFYP